MVGLGLRETMKRKYACVILLLAFLPLVGCVSIYRSVREDRDANYIRGIELYQANKMEEAHARFETVVEIEPDYKDAKLYLAKTEKRLSLKKKNSELKANMNYDKGIEWMGRGRYEEALPLLLAARKQDPDLEAVDEKINECRNRLAPVFEKLVNQAEQQYQQKRYVPAYRTCLKAEAFGLEDASFSALLEKIKGKLKTASGKDAEKGKRLLIQKKYAPAQTAFRAALALCPWDENLKTLLEKAGEKLVLDQNYQRGVMLCKQGNYYDARTVLNQVTIAEPGYKETGRYLNKINQALGSQAKNLYNSGVVAYSQGNYEAAINDFNKVLAINPGHTNAQEYLQRTQNKLKLQKTVEDSTAR
jgi:tetratricopeptide (TPR) repeat protein